MGKYVIILVPVTTCPLLAILVTIAFASLGPQFFDTVAQIGVITGGVALGCLIAGGLTRFSEARTVRDIGNVCLITGSVALVVSILLLGIVCLVIWALLVVIVFAMGLFFSAA